MAPESPFLAGMERVSRHGEQRWRRPDRSRYYTWDRLHHDVEVWNKRGRHLGSANAVTGILIKPARKGYTIDV